MKIDYFSGSNIISLQPARTKVHFPAISMVEAYWEGLRDERTMPARAEIDPRGISDALEYTFILEKIAPGQARIRLSGNHLNELTGMEVRGMPLAALFLPEARIQMKEIIENVLNTPASVHVDLASDSGFTRPGLQAQMYLAPMKDETGAPTRILGVLQTTGLIGRAPRRFNVKSINMNVLDGRQNPFATSSANPGAPQETNPRRVLGFAEQTAGFQTETLKQRGNDAENSSAAPGLRLVSNNDA